MLFSCSKWIWWCLTNVVLSPHSLSLAWNRQCQSQVKKPSANEMAKIEVVHERINKAPPWPAIEQPTCGQPSPYVCATPSSPCITTRMKHCWHFHPCYTNPSRIHGSQEYWKNNSWHILRLTPWRRLSNVMISNLMSNEDTSPCTL